jgi:hypothetical protein
MSDIKGLRELTAKLNNMSDAVQAEMLENALIAGGMLIVNEAKILSAYLTGTQKRSIHIGGFTQLTPEFSQGGESDYSDIGRPEGSKHEQSIRIGTNVIYARRNEYERKAFMRPAFDSEQGAARQEIIDVLEILIEKSAK